MQLHVHYTLKAKLTTLQIQMNLKLHMQLEELFYVQNFSTKIIIIATIS